MEQRFGWVEWNGGERPVPNGTIVKLLYRSEIDRDNYYDIAGTAPYSGWQHLSDGDDIVAYKIIRDAAGNLVNADVPENPVSMFRAKSSTASYGAPLPTIALGFMVPPLSGEDLVAGAPQVYTGPIPMCVDWIAPTVTAEDLLAGDTHEMVTFGPLTPGFQPWKTWEVRNPSAGNVIKLPVREMPSTGPGRAINPKDAIGSTKLPMHLWPAEATALGCLGMLEGEEKYGRNNFIAGDGVVASIYIDAAKRHLDAWFAGEECAPDTGTPHLANALATIAIVVKCMAHDRLIDDRDYSPLPEGSAYRKFIDEITPHVKRLQAMFADKSPRHYTIGDVEQRAA